MSDNRVKQIDEVVKLLREKGVQHIDAAIILGTGLHGLADEIKAEVEIPYNDIPHFPISTVEFHSGKLIYGTLGNKKVIAFNGRFHFYEGYDMRSVAFPVWVAKQLGAPYLLISNAAGNMHPQWKKGELMLVNDHINLQPSNPLIGKNVDEWGPRFPDMSQAYHSEIRKGLQKIASEKGMTLREGVYISVTGPQLETAAEYRFLRKLGADAVGMSTVPEVIAANHCGLPVAAISVLTDDCDPEDLQPVDIAEIIAIAGQAEPLLTELFTTFIQSTTFQA